MRKLQSVALSPHLDFPEFWFARIDSQEIHISISPTAIRATWGQPHHSRFYPQSIHTIISLGNDPKGGLRGAIRKTWVPKGAQIDSRESFVIRANTVDAEIITKWIPQTILCVTEVITQIKLIPRETFLCNRLAIARLHYTQEHPLHYTNSFAWNYFCVHVMDYISQTDAAENGLVSKVPEGRHPRGTTLREALRGNLPLRNLCGGLSEGSAGFSPRVLRGSAGFSEVSRG